jgi:hypothetical protein
MFKPKSKRVRLFSRLMTAFGIAAGLCLIAGGLHAGARSQAASPDAPETVLQSPLAVMDGAGSDRTGTSVAISGNTALVAAPGLRAFPGAVPGAVLVFQRIGSVWNAQAKLLPNETAIALPNYGTSVAIDGDIAVIGAPRYLGGQLGAAYVFRRNGTTWSLQQRLMNNQFTFGASVAVSGETIVVGDTSGTGQALVYRWNGTTWALQATLLGPDRGPGDLFGNSVAIEGDTIVVGALADNIPAADDAGSVTVFQRSGTTWTQQAFLTASDPHFSDFFGCSVALNGNTLAVGAYNADTPGVAVDAGAAYVFQRNGTTWSQTAKLVASDGKPGDRLGFSIALNGDTIVSGAAYYDLPNRQNAGATYVFQRTNSVWTQTSVEFTDTGAPGDLYGNGVAISGNTIITGEPNQDRNSIDDIGSGFAYTFRPNNRNTSDFEGDGLTDLAVFRPTDNTWYAKQSSNSLLFTRQFGASGDLLAPGDYDGDGRTDLAVFRPSNGTWYILQSSNNVIRSRQFGASGDLPVSGDYDGNGLSDIAVYRPSSGAWYITMGISNSVRTEQFGASGDRPVPGDYDGDGRTDLAVFRPTENSWYIFQSADNSVRALAWGTAGDVTVPADYSGDTKTDIAVFRPSNGTWYILSSPLNQLQAQPWGASGDIPAPGDYDGDGRADICVFRPANGTWYILQTASNTLRAEAWGASGDVPVTAAFNQ